MMQWLGVLTGPVVLLTSLSIAYALVHFACASGERWPLHAVSVIALLLTLGGALSAWYIMRTGRSPDENRTAARSRFMAIIGLMLSGYFVLVVIVLTIPQFMLSACA